MQYSTYHRFLRVATVVMALVLVFDSGLIAESTARLSNGTGDYLANAIGVGASVEPTELNQLTAELTAQKRALEEREAAIEAREISVGLREGGSAATDYSTYILASVLFILLVLILLNYTLDYLRAQERRRLSAQTV